MSIQQDVLETPRLLLTPRSLADLEDCIRMDSDPEVVRYIAGPWSDPIEHRAFITARTLANYPARQGYWVIRPLADPSRFLGWVLLLPLDGEGPETEVGWRLPRSQWGKGIATEAAAAVLAQGFKNPELNEVVADIHPSNLSSQRVAVKLGFAASGARVHHGELHERYVLRREHSGLGEVVNAGR